MRATLLSGKKKKKNQEKTVSPILETEFNQGKTVEDVVQHSLPGRWAQ